MASRGDGSRWTSPDGGGWSAAPTPGWRAHAAAASPPSPPEIETNCCTHMIDDPSDSRPAHTIARLKLTARASLAGG